MANAEQLTILKQGVEVWNMWREQNQVASIDLTRADLTGADLFDADLTGVKLGRANLFRANLWKANLKRADLSEAELADAYIKNGLLIGADLTGAILWRADLSRANLNEADLTGADLTEANLTDAKLGRANLERAQLIRADISKADLRGANLIGADLSDADLSGADLSEAHLREADLRGADLTGARLRANNFLNVRVGGTTFGSLDLREIIGLERISHYYPSSVSTATFFLSNGEIPRSFLRGCGLSDWEIEAMKLYNHNLSNEEILTIQYRMYDLRATQALQISPLFVSYSHLDSEFVNKIGNHLKKKDIRYWRDIHDLKSGRIEKQIDRAIRYNPILLLVLSKNSLNSDWVEYEVRKATALEKEMSRDVICPVALDDSWKSSRWPERVMNKILDYSILDFSAWEDDTKFNVTFRKLIDGLGLFYKG
jgi:uncharacterized protein YjbI with pentapeptide repeats